MFILQSFYQSFVSNMLSMPHWLKMSEQLFEQVEIFIPIQDSPSWLRKR